MSDDNTTAAAGTPEPGIDLEGSQFVEDPAAAPSTDSGESAETATDAKPTSARDYLTKAFTEMDGTGEAAAGDEQQAEASADDAAPEETPDPAKPAPEPEAKADKEPDADAKTETDPASEQDGQEAEAPATPPPAIVTREEIDKQFPRTSKEIRDVAGANAEAALAYKAKIDKIGGEDYLPSFEQIAQGFDEDNNIPIFSGMLSLAGADRFTGIVGDIVEIALVRTQDPDYKTQSQGDAFFQEECRRIIDEALEKRLGEGAKFEHLEKLWKYDQSGHLNTADVDRYYADGAEEDDSPNPLAAENKQLKEQIAALESAGKDQPKTDDSALAAEFDKTATTDADKVFDDLFLKKSVLRPVKGDAKELADGKAKALELVRKLRDEALRADPAYEKLRKGSLKGESETARYKKAYSTLMDQSLAAARREAAGLEQLVSLVYQLTHNAKLPGGTEALPENENATEKGISPDATQTKTAEKKAVTREENRAYITRELAKT